MRASRGMGIISPSKMPKPKKAKRRDDADTFTQYAEGGEVLDKPGLYKNIWDKRRRIAAGSGEKMRKPGAKGAPTAQAFKQSALTAKK